MKHLEAVTATGDPYYKLVNESVLEEAKEKSTKILKEDFDNDVLTKEEYNAMIPANNLVPGRFYGKFKVHKKYEHGKAPPLRGIVSCSNTLMENIVSVLGREEGYPVKYTPPPEGGGVYLTVYPESSPNTDIISF